MDKFQKVIFGSIGFLVAQMIVIVFFMFNTPSDGVIISLIVCNTLVVLSILVLVYLDRAKQKMYEEKKHEFDEKMKLNQTIEANIKLQAENDSLKKNSQDSALNVIEKLVEMKREYELSTEELCKFSKLYNDIK